MASGKETRKGGKVNKKGRIQREFYKEVEEEYEGACANTRIFRNAHVFLSSYILV
jgi:hypothetical protein